MNATECLVHSDPETMSGAPVFVGTRVLVTTMFDYLETGETLEEFLDDFPSVSRDMAVSTLQLCCELLVNHANTSR